MMFLFLSSHEHTLFSSLLCPKRADIQHLIVLINQGINNVSHYIVSSDECISILVLQLSIDIFLCLHTSHCISHEFCRKSRVYLLQRNVHVAIETSKNTLVVNSSVELDNHRTTSDLQETIEKEINTKT